DVVLGQFDGYTDHDDIDDDSRTETFAAARLSIDNDRWRDTPVFLRTGKHMAVTVTEAAMVFRSTGDGAAGTGTPNLLRFGIKPHTAIDIELVVLDTEGDDHGTRPVRLTACAPDDHGELGDYATMLHGAMTGDHRHFARIDGIVAAWRVIDPIQAAELRPERYAKGSMGPAAGDRLPGENGWLPLRRADD
ncbi:MAG: glucose-6-phosphate dehydrogenase, partial [Ilumatobacter sp.]|nr:glucose-6-phosphate dehydrogenase [Ilumatobacter sp.]